MTAVSSIRLLVVFSSPPNSSFSWPPARIHTPQPPGPGLPLQAPSDHIWTTGIESAVGMSRSGPAFPVAVRATGPPSDSLTAATGPPSDSLTAATGPPSVRRARPRSELLIARRASGARQGGSQGRGEEAQPVRAGPETGFGGVLGMRHEAHHVASRVGDAGDVPAGAVRVAHVAEHHAALPFQFVQGGIVVDELAVLVLQRHGDLLTAVVLVGPG